MNSLTERLKASIAIQHLGKAIHMQYTIFFSTPEAFSKEELEDLISQVEFYQAQTGKSLNYIVSIQNEIEKL